MEIEKVTSIRGKMLFYIQKNTIFLQKCTSAPKHKSVTDVNIGITD